MSGTYHTILTAIRDQVSAIRFPSNLASEIVRRSCRLLRCEASDSEPCMRIQRSLVVGGLVGAAVVGGSVGGCAPKTRKVGAAMPAQASPSAAPSTTSPNTKPTLDTSQPLLTPRVTSAPTPASASAAVDYRDLREGLKGRDTDLSFHLVADLPETVAFAPLGRDSLLVAGDCDGPQPLLIEANQLRFLPELAGAVQRKNVMTCVSSIGGTWPDNTWAAVSGASDAGPSSSDVYQWAPGRGWVLKHEYDPWVFEVVPWRGNMVFLSKCQACGVPQRPDFATRLSSGKWLRQAQPLAYQLPGERAAPAWLHEGALSLFGYEGDPFDNVPSEGRVLLMETWTSAGTKTLRRMPLPKGHEQAVVRLALNKNGWVAWLPSLGQAPARLARFDKNGWTTVTELPAKFTALSAPASGSLWGIVQGYLLSWSNPDWAITELPRDAKFAGLSWESVWQRSSKDIWLIGKAGTEPARYLLFNTADGKTGPAFPSEVDRKKLGPSPKNEDETEGPLTCPNPYADFLKLTPFQYGFDSSIEMSPEQARRALQAVLSRSEYRHLDFVKHRCYGENCIGAVVRNVQEAVEVRKELEAIIVTIVKADTSNHSPPATWLLSHNDLRCLPPPETTPFSVPR